MSQPDKQRASRSGDQLGRLARVWPEVDTGDLADALDEQRADEDRRTRDRLHDRLLGWIHGT